MGEAQKSVEEGGQSHKGVCRNDKQYKVDYTQSFLVFTMHACTVHSDASQQKKTRCVECITHAYTVSIWHPISQRGVPIPPIVEEKGARTENLIRYRIIGI